MRINGVVEPSLLEEEWDEVKDVSFENDGLIFPPSAKNGDSTKPSGLRNVLGERGNLYS